MGELRKAGHYDKIGQAFAVLLPTVKSVGVMGDHRTYENVCVLRAVQTSDFMTADWYQMPYDLIGRISNRICNEVRGINRSATMSPLSLQPRLSGSDEALLTVLASMIFFIDTDCPKGRSPVDVNGGASQSLPVGLQAAHI